MAKYVLVNRRAGKFTSDAKAASRASVAAALTRVPDATILHDHAPADPLARRVVVLDLAEDEAHRLGAGLGPDTFLEPLVRRGLHHVTPTAFRHAAPMAHRRPKAGAAASGDYSVTVTGGGQALGGVQVMFYSRQSADGQSTTVTADANGVATLQGGASDTISYVEPIPNTGFWIMLEAAPANGSQVDCLAIPKAPASGQGWWHQALGAGSAGANGTGVKVGVIDTGCGPHPNLKHVNLAGVFNGGQSGPADQATDVAQHGTHTSGIVGARPTNAGDFAGIAPGCDLYHVRVFASEDQGPTNADLIQAIDALSRDHQCDLINMSLGGGPPSPAEEDAIKDALERGTLCVCSAGNDGGAVNYPGAYAECVSVSAIGQIGWAPNGTFSDSNTPQDASAFGTGNLFLAAFSSNGPNLSTCGPGVGIISTVPDRGGLVGQYMEMDGTSMASPAVCGALAVILSRDASYLALPRDSTRSSAARQALTGHCQNIGLSRSYQGDGLPLIS